MQNNLFSKKFMHYLLSKHPQVLLTVDAESSQLLKTTLTPHPPGFACQLKGYPSKLLVNAIFEFLHQYARGIFSSFPLDLSPLPDFTRAVLEHLQQLSIGEIISYKDVAERLGHPRAARAVGGACGRNPFPLFIPCHRIIASNGSMGGFSLDIQVKQRLLEFEKLFIS